MTMTRRTIRGYTNLGPVHFNPAIPDIVLTDRGDGTEWLLQTSSGYVMIETPVPSTFRGRTYEALFGPVLDTEFGQVVLLVRDGYLGYDGPSDGTVRTPPPFFGNRTQARLGLNDVYQIIVPDDFAYGDELAYETEPTV